MNGTLMMDDDENRQKSIESALASLQPLRDLAKNWDIDIASCLEDYLHELGSTVDLGEAVDDGMETEEAVKPNFAKAALVLHNSSHIYSRKVEYLYSLVNQTLDSLLAVSSQKKASRGRSVDPEIEDFRDFDPHQEFLLLDDVLPTDKSDDCRHINLAPTATEIEVSRRFSLASNGTATPHRNLSLRTQNLSSSTLGKSFHTLSVSKALNQISTSSTAVLRLMDGQCDLDPSGRLLVPGCQNTSPLVKDPPATVDAPLGESEYAAGGDFQGDQDDYDDGPGFAMADDDDVNMNEGLNEAANRKRVTFAPENTHKPTASIPARPDPWALLDPHTLDQGKSRPFRLGKTLRLPPGIDDFPSDGVTGARTRKWKIPSIKVAMEETVNPKFFAAETFHNLSRKRRHDGEDEEKTSTDAGTSLPNLPLKGLLYGNEFAYLAREHAERKASERRQMRRLQKQWERTNGPSPTGEVAYAGFDDDEDDYGSGFAFAGDDDNDYGGEAGESPVIETNTGLQAVEEVYLNRHEDDTDSVADARAFEALCRAHINKFARGAEKYASETQLTKRVDQWQEKLEPLLLEEVHRPVFDIHEYGKTVLESLEVALEERPTKSVESPTSAADFGEVTKDCANYQVCRYFLATLSLCNTGNVGLEQHGTTNSLSLKLLSMDTSRPMETYLAPSVAEQS